MAAQLLVSSTANGLSTERHLLAPGKHRLFVSGPDWSGGKTAKVYVSYEDVDASYRPFKKPDFSFDDITFAANDVIEISGGVWIALFLANAGTGATLHTCNPTPAK